MNSSSMNLSYAIQGDHKIPSYLRRTDDSKNFNFYSPTSSQDSPLKEWQRPSSTNSTNSERQWNLVASKVHTKKELVLLNKRRSHRIRSLTMRPPIVQQSSLIPDDMRMSTKLPPLEADINRLNIFLEQAESRLIKGYSGSSMHNLLLEKQLLYSATFAELSAQVSATGGEKTSTFLNRIWKLNQSIFDEFLKLYQKGLKEADRKVEKMEKKLSKQVSNSSKNESGFSNSIAGVVMMQLANIREKRKEKQREEQEAKISALTKHIEFVPPSFENQVEDQISLDDANDNIMKQYDDVERAQVIAMTYSGCDKELEKFAHEMIESTKPKSGKSINNPVSKTGKVRKESWVQLPGVKAAVHHFSAIIVVNADLRGVLTRGQQIKIGTTKMCVHTQKGNFSAISFPVDQFWPGEPTSSLPLYVKNTDIDNKQFDDDSDMEEERNEDIDWVLIPCTCTLTNKDNMVFTSSDMTKILKRKTRVKIKGKVFKISDLNTLPFNYECFPLDSIWKAPTEKNVPLLAEADGIWGWDKGKDIIDQAVLEKEKVKNDLSPWVMTGITVDVTEHKERAITHEDSTSVLVPGQMIKIDQTIVHLSLDNIDKNGFNLKWPWEKPSNKELCVQIRRHEMEIAKVKLHDAFRMLGSFVNNLDTNKASKENENLASIETQTECTQVIDTGAQTTLKIQPDEHLSTVISTINTKNGMLSFHESEMIAARKIMLISHRRAKKGTPAMDLSNTVHLFIQLCRDKRKADAFANMLNEKHLTFPEFTLDFFLSKFGLLKLAHVRILICLLIVTFLYCDLLFIIIYTQFLFLCYSSLFLFYQCFT
jgi:hypothetical protein